ncbi:TPA: hypothetical protein L4G09_001962 [Pseudomonas aeruginosa]|nr:hypothetical protein [Pseudomonas aeruginosa]
MNKANECTCPSGDGSLRHPCPAHPAVEQVGGDEREAKPGLFCRDCGGRLAVRGVCSIYCPKCEKGDGGSDNSGVPAEAAVPESVALLYRRSDGNDRAWSVTCDPHYMEFFRKADGYESKLLVDAALAQPSPVSEPLIYACKSLAQITSSDGSGHADIALAVLRMAGVGDDERERLVNEWKAARAWKPSPAQVKQAEAERPEAVAWRYGFSGGIVSDKACLDEWKSGGEYQSLMTVAQHERIVGELRAENERLANDRDRANQFANGAALEINAALARVAELETLQQVDEHVIEHLSLQMDIAESNASSRRAQAQHSVPEELRAICMLVAETGIKYGRGRHRAVASDECRAVVNAVLNADLSVGRACEYAGCCDKAHPGTSLCIAHHSKKAREQLLAAAPGKEVGHE